MAWHEHFKYPATKQAAAEAEFLWRVHEYEEAGMSRADALQKAANEHGDLLEAARRFEAEQQTEAAKREAFMGKSALDALNRKAEAILAKNAHLTKAQAFVRAVELNPDLYEAYRRGQTAEAQLAAVEKADQNETKRLAIWKEAERRAEELLEADATLTRESAIAKVLEENPDLFRQWSEAQ